MDDGESSDDCEGFIERGVSRDRFFQLVRFRGELRASDIAIMTPPVSDHRLDGVTLFDVRYAQIDISYAEGRDLSAEIGARRSRKKARGAYLVADDYTYGLARMYSGSAGVHYEEQKIFRDLDEAIAWLGVEPGQLAEAEAALVRMNDAAD